MSLGEVLACAFFGRFLGTCEEPDEAQKVLAAGSPDPASVGEFPAGDQLAHAVVLAENPSQVMVEPETFV